MLGWASLRMAGSPPGRTGQHRPHPHDLGHTQCPGKQWRLGAPKRSMGPSPRGGGTLSHRCPGRLAQWDQLPLTKRARAQVQCAKAGKEVATTLGPCRYVTHCPPVLQSLGTQGLKGPKARGSLLGLFAEGLQGAPNLSSLDEETAFPGGREREVIPHSPSPRRKI